jgi:hypothetical protein
MPAGLLRFLLCLGPKNGLEGPDRRSVAQLGSALAWGARGRRFKSFHSDHFWASPVHSVNQTQPPQKNGKMRTEKPVSRVLSSPARARDDHSSRARRYRRPQATDPDRKAGNRPRRDPYLVLLPVGFAVPVPLPVPRCALTAPFHPYRALRRGGLFSVALSIGVRRLSPKPSGRYPAPRFREARTFLPGSCEPRRPSGFPILGVHPALIRP